MKKQTKLNSNQSILLKNSKILDILNDKSSVQDILIINGKIADLGKIKDVENCIEIDSFTIYNFCFSTSNWIFSISTRDV